MPSAHALCVIATRITGYINTPTRKQKNVALIQGKRENGVGDKGWHGISVSKKVQKDGIDPERRKALKAIVDGAKYSVPAAAVLSVSAQKSGAPTVSPD